MEGTSMACPHISGVLALGISYAAQLNKHFTAAELQKLLVDSAVDIDSYFVGTKRYCRYVADIGTIQPMQLDMAQYRGGMGGQVNATAFLAAIEGKGVDMRFPNIYVATEGQVAILPARYFKGENLSFTVTIADTSVATVEKSGSKLLFKGVKSGSTTATITASTGSSQSFTITVRRGANDNGWL
jgi:hypothetical protein